LPEAKCRQPRSATQADKAGDNGNLASIVMGSTVMLETCFFPFATTTVLMKSPPDQAVTSGQAMPSIENVCDATELGRLLVAASATDMIANIRARRNTGVERMAFLKWRTRGGDSGGNNQL